MRYLCARLLPIVQAITRMMRRPKMAMIRARRGLNWNVLSVISRQDDVEGKVHVQVWGCL